MLIYMVCSFFDIEGKLQINKFLKKNNNYILLKFNTKNIYYTNNLIYNNGFYYVVPSVLKNSVLIDGFFAGIIRKND